MRLSTRAMRDKITSELNEKFADQQVLAIGDYNGDGRMDLVVYNGREDVIRVWYLNGYTLEHAETVEDPGNAWYFASVDGRTPGSH